MSLTREELQRQGLNKWAKDGFRGILRWATGIGKSYAAILAIEHSIKENKKASILIVCPTFDVIVNFQKEFVKFKKKSLLQNCKFICYASINKQTDFYDLVILDEVHHVTTPNRVKFLQFGKYSKLLGLSASLTPKQLQILQPYCPVVDTLTIQDVQDEGFISDFTIINFPVNLTESEGSAYRKHTATIEFTKAHYGTMAWKAIGKRTQILYSAENKLKVINDIIELFPNQYGILFSLTKQASEEIAELVGEKCISIHSGHTKKQRLSRMKAMTDGRTKIRIISTPKILDEGVTVARLSYGLLIARYSKERQLIQSLGRIIRAEKGKHAFAVRLFVKGTVEEKWVEDSQNGFNVINVNSLEELERIIKTTRGTTK